MRCKNGLGRKNPPDLTRQEDNETDGLRFSGKSLGARPDSGGPFGERIRKAGTRLANADPRRGSWPGYSWEDSIPPELVDRLSSNLFLEEGESPDASHPTEEALAALLGPTASAKAKLPGSGEINLDRKSMREARKASS